MSTAPVPKARFSKWIKWLWTFFLGGLLFFALYIYLVSIDFMGWFGAMPSLEDLENPKDNLSSTVITADGVELGKYFRENRNPVAYKDLSPHLIHALKATEDARFEDHSGIDIMGMARVAFKSVLLRQKSSGGGSTISQQLAKNLFNTRNKALEGSIQVGFMKLIIAKTKEWITAVRLERRYTKEEILSMYLNTVDFGNNAYGIQTAARTYFNTTPDSLSIPQAAVLVGLLKGTTMYNPVANPASAMERRNVVLEQMEKYGYLSAAEAENFKKDSIKLSYQIENHNSGSGTYFRSVMTDFLLEWCKQNNYDLYSDGLKIYTTIDSRMQRYAEESVEKHMRTQQKIFFEHWKTMTPWRDENYREIPNFIHRAMKNTDRYRELAKKYGADTVSLWKELNTKRQMTIYTLKGERDTLFSSVDSLKYYKYFLRTGFMAMEPQTGQIKAWVGGVNHKFFKFDHVKKALRQPGSTFKPFVYATAIDQGFHPCQQIIDAPISFETGDPKKPIWSPENSDGRFTNNPYTIRKAMANSINSITARLIKEVGPEQVLDMARRLGIESPLDAVPALCLGVNDVNVYEMVGAYSAFVNKGLWIKPNFITRIEDKNGKIIAQFIPETKRALSEEKAQLMIHMLKGAVQEKGGTALGLWSYQIMNHGIEVGAKTGTTQNYSDGWFMGVTPHLAAGVWVGGEDRCIHFRTMDLGQGAAMALPIWAVFMEKTYADKTIGLPKEGFPKVDKKKSTVELDCSKYQQAPLTRDSSYIHKQSPPPIEDF